MYRILENTRTVIRFTIFLVNCLVFCSRYNQSISNVCSLGLVVYADRLGFHHNSVFWNSFLCLFVTHTGLECTVSLVAYMCPALRKPENFFQKCYQHIECKI